MYMTPIIGGPIYLINWLVTYKCTLQRYCGYHPSESPNITMYALIVLH